MYKLFADDTKVYIVVNNGEHQYNRQNDINMLQWSDTWLLKFNTCILKCKHLHLGHPTNTKRTMGESEIKKVSDEKDLGIVIDDKLKCYHHINQQTVIQTRDLE